MEIFEILEDFPRILMVSTSNGPISELKRSWLGKRLLSHSILSMCCTLSMLWGRSETSRSRVFDLRIPPLVRNRGTTRGGFLKNRGFFKNPKNFRRLRRRFYLKSMVFIRFFIVSERRRRKFCGFCTQKHIS